MKNLLSKVLKSLILISLVSFSIAPLSAQMHCRTTLGSHLTPIVEGSNHLMAIEGTMAPGVITGYRISGGMLLGALDFTLSNKMNLYFEGGIKNWSTDSLDNGNERLFNEIKFKSRNVGVRQLFVTYENESSQLKVGLHETKLGNYLLLDERILGGSFDHSHGAFDINLRAGTVLKKFARMGHFCANRHLYNLLEDSRTENIGKKLGETNLVGVAVSWNPHYVKPAESSGEDEFSEFGEFDEFSEFGDEAEFAEEKSHLVKNVGFISYNEFGRILDTTKHYIGTLVDLDFPLDMTMRTGVVYQNMLGNNALVYITQFHKQHLWNSGMSTNLNLSYIGKVEIDENATFQPLFSNLFIGEVMRMDAVDFPLWTAEMKHHFGGKYKYRLVLKAVGQIEGNETQEFTIENQVHLFGHVQSTLLLSHIESEAFENAVNMARLEVRVAF